MEIRRYREVPGRDYQTPKEVWGFRLPASGGSTPSVARRTLGHNRDMLGLTGILRDLHLRRTISSVGAAHVIFSQRHLDRYVHRAYVTVHMDLANRVYLIKNRAVPQRLLPRSTGSLMSATRAQSSAERALPGRAHAHLLQKPEQVWYPARKLLHLAYKFRLERRRPAQDWIVYVDARTGSLLSAWDNLAESAGRATVFDPNPVVALADSRALLADDVPVPRVPARAYREARVTGLDRSGWLDGARVTTRRTNPRVQRPDLDFRCRSHQPGFEEVMAYYHLDRAVRYVEGLGYRGRRRIFREPIAVDARATREDESWYSPGTRALGFGTGDVDDAEDGETILHEFGHALQDAICPDFGQSAQAAAMGEGFGDYFAASFFADAKSSPAARIFQDTVMTWDGILCDPGDAGAGPPCVRRLDRKATYESFDHSPQADEHDNGEIWAATLWKIWRALGRDVADRVIIESHFQLDGFTTFAKGARAILDADRNLYRGRHLARLKSILAAQGIGPLG